MINTAWKFILVALAGWIHRKQEDVIGYLREENSVLSEQLGPGRLRFTDAQRRRLAAKAKALGRRGLRDVDTLVTPVGYHQNSKHVDSGSWGNEITGFALSEWLARCDCRFPGF